ncbi:unnamed protein product [Blepharisma stoltei]|uniref:Uncharacterized protein n=1 Tax=Blepharisma stoltei TaxID=1481888 RepID=A0AAU9K4K7_9CILI|nr:unnamed protein product [Blepharisma stoltei]
MENFKNYDESLPYSLKTVFLAGNLPQISPNKPKTQKEIRRNNPYYISFDNSQAKRIKDYSVYQWNDGIFELKDQESSFTEKINYSGCIPKISPIEQRIAFQQARLLKVPSKDNNNDSLQHFKKLIEKSLNKSRKPAKITENTQCTPDIEKIDISKFLDMNKPKPKSKKLHLLKNEKNSAISPYKRFLNRIPTLNNPYKRACKSRSGSLMNESLTVRQINSHRENSFRDQTKEQILNGIRDSLLYLPYTHKRTAKHRKSKDSVYTESSGEELLLDSKLNS